MFTTELDGSGVDEAQCVQKFGERHERHQWPAGWMCWSGVYKPSPTPDGCEQRRWLVELGAHMTLAWNVPKLHLSCTASLQAARRVASAPLASACWGTLYRTCRSRSPHRIASTRSSKPFDISLPWDPGSAKSRALIADITRSSCQRVGVIVRASASPCPKRANVFDLPAQNLGLPCGVASKQATATSCAPLGHFCNRSTALGQCSW